MGVANERRVGASGQSVSLIQAPSTAHLVWPTLRDDTHTHIRGTCGSRPTLSLQRSQLSCPGTYRVYDEATPEITGRGMESEMFMQASFMVCGRACAQSGRMYVR